MNRDFVIVDYSEDSVYLARTGGRKTENFMDGKRISGSERLRYEGIAAYIFTTRPAQLSIVIKKI